MKDNSIYVIIPVYNAEKYIARTLDSLIQQTEQNWFCFLCDDGSTDHTLRIISEYAEEDRRFFVFHQENKGVGATLNRLLDKIPDSAQYVAILDADDVIHPQMYEILKENLIETQADVAECFVTSMQNEKPIIDLQRFKKGDYKTTSVVNPFKIIFEKKDNPYSYSWFLKINKLYRWDKIKSLKFDESLPYEEDYFYNTQLHYFIRSKVVVELPLYYYRKHNESVTGNVHWKKYQEAGARRIELSYNWFVKENRIPAKLESIFNIILAQDAFRMIVLKPLRRSRHSPQWVSKRQQFFKEAQTLMRHLIEINDLKEEYFTFYQRLVLRCLDKGFYRLTLMLLLLK